MTARDFTARSFDGDLAGITSAIAYAGSNGVVHVYPGNAAITILPSLQTLPFDPLKDLTPISTSLLVSIGRPEGALVLDRFGYKILFPFQILDYPSNPA